MNFEIGEDLTKLSPHVRDPHFMRQRVLCLQANNWWDDVYRVYSKLQTQNSRTFQGHFKDFHHCFPAPKL